MSMPINWAAMSESERRKHVEKMQAGRQKRAAGADANAVADFLKNAEPGGGGFYSSLTLGKAPLRPRWNYHKLPLNASVQMYNDAVAMLASNNWIPVELRRYDGFFEIEVARTGALDSDQDSNE